MDLLNFIFTDIWHFIGSMLLLEAVCKTLIYVVRALKAVPDCPETESDAAN